MRGPWLRLPAIWSNTLELSCTEASVTLLADQRRAIKNDCAFEETCRSIRINDASGLVNISMAQAVVRSLAVNAAKVNQRAQRVFTQLLSIVERDNKRFHDEWFDTAVNYKVESDRESEGRACLGIAATAPLPQKNYIVLDMNTRIIRIKRLMTKRDKVQ